MWQIVCIIDILRVDVAYKIILKKYNEQKKNATTKTKQN